MSTFKKRLSAKIAKIRREGIRGRPVSQKQAVAVAYSILRKGRKRRKK